MLKYFLNRDGIPTKRIAGKAGGGHIEIAHVAERDLVPGQDVYEQMFRLGYARVVETDSEVMVDCPKPLTARQKDYLLVKEREGKTITLNNRAFVESREGRAKQVLRAVCANPAQVALDEFVEAELAHRTCEALADVKTP